MAFVRLFYETFQYHDKPDGEDPVGKVMGLAKIGLTSSTFLSIYDACLISKCANAAQFLNTAGYYFIPITGMCFAFSSVTYVSTHLRKKDDHWNYFLGALASGSVLHAWMKKPVVSGWGTFVMVLYAVGKKEITMGGYEAKKNLVLPEKLYPKYVVPWRNVPYRNYSTSGRYPFEKDYYVNFPTPKLS